VAIEKLKDGFAVESYLPRGSPEQRVAGIAVAAGGALLAAAVLGVGPGGARWGSRLPCVRRDLSRVQYDFAGASRPESQRRTAGMNGERNDEVVAREMQQRDRKERWKLWLGTPLSGKKSRLPESKGLVLYEH